ncbi:Cu-Zn family superoxide dismutase [Saccharothrix carnea]|uniref:Cu-Zn family superoxide dismutase n=1 Tax=Saccharothrix carnea TaxID=1280637 RepID=A0A2P8I4P7_SACCR|nr:superoxide dismutase [Saccharothrix carnea]PSL53404.1 Cu-Zn family superoxide dismutase [Saccharothrix carnea]
MKSLVPLVIGGLLATAVTPTAAADGSPGSGVAITVARFATPDAATKAYTYDTALIAPGAAVMVVATPLRYSTKALLSVYGLVPNRTYGAHAHQHPCGAAPADAGAHHQHVVDPRQPSVDPAYANPDNEIWLDFTTDDRGRAVVGTVVPWQFADRRAGSVVVHAQRTATEPGKAGTAGPRVGCATVRF